MAKSTKLEQLKQREAREKAAFLAAHKRAHDALVRRQRAERATQRERWTQAGQLLEALGYPLDLDSLRALLSGPTRSEAAPSRERLTRDSTEMCRDLCSVSVREGAHTLPRDHAGSAPSAVPDAVDGKGLVSTSAFAANAEQNHAHHAPQD
jgi:hypothetical protein